MQQGIDARHRIELAEAFADLLAQDRPVVGRQTFLGSRPGVEHGAEFLLFLSGQTGRSALLALGLQGRQAAAAVAAHPLVHELTRASQRGGDLLAFELRLISQTFPGDEHHAVTIALLGIGFLGNPFPELLSV